MLEYTLCPVQELVPHSPPMVLIDKILNYSNDSLIAEVDISPESMFFDGSVAGVPVWVGMEYMAQSISALAGVRAKMENQGPKLGFLLGTRKYVMHEKVFTSGNSYQVYVDQLFRDESGLASFKCQIKLNETLIAEAKVNVFESAGAEALARSDDV